MTDERRYLKKGDKVRCINDSFCNLTKGDVYDVTVSEYTHASDKFIKVIDDLGYDKQFWSRRFELVEEGTHMKTKHSTDFTGLKAGDTLIRSGESTSWWTNDKSYPVYGDADTLYIIDDEGDRRYFIVEKDGTVTHKNVHKGFYWNKAKKVYTEEDIYAGMKLECVNDGGYVQWTQGKIYEVDENFTIYSDASTLLSTDTILHYLNNTDRDIVIFKEVEKKVHTEKVEKKVYTEEDIKMGMKLRCTHNAGFDFWTVDKIYEVVADDMNRPCIYSDSKPYSGSYRDTEEIALYLNCNSKDSEDNVAMEIVDMPEVSETFDEDVVANEEIVLVIKGKNYYELRDEAIAIQRLLNSIIEDSESLNESLTNLSTFYGSEK